MAEGDATVWNNFKEQLLLKTIDCDTDTFKVALYSVSQTPPDGAAPAYTSTNEISAANYSAGGVAVGAPVVTQDDTNNRASWDDNGSNISWTSLGAATIVEACLYDDTTATKWRCISWEIATNSNGGNYTLAFHANGIMLLS